MTSSTSRRSRSTVHRGAALAVASVLALCTLLAGCTASDSGTDESMPQDNSAADEDAGGASQPEAAGDDFAAGAADTERQVIQTGDISITVEDPQDAADQIVTLTEKAGGRVDNRSEQAATAQDVGTAQLTIRLPADEVSGAVDTLRTLGTIDQINLTATDVTGAAQDLDARIHGLEISVARMEDLLARASTSAEVIAAEGALAERQTNLEQLKAERARLAEQVALSTLTVALYGPGLAPEVVSTGPDSFLDGLTDGWNSLVSVVEFLVILLGVLLPWLVVGGLITLASVALVRRHRRLHPRPEPTPAPRPWELVGAGVGPGAGQPGQPAQPPAAPPAHDPNGE